MNFACEKCQRKYTIADEKVRGKTVKIRCKSCENVVTVSMPAAPEPAYELPPEDRTRAINLNDLEKLRAEAEQSQSVTAPAAAASASPWEDNESTRAVSTDSSAQWFAMVNGNQAGPMGAPEFTVRAAKGEIELSTFVWKDGMPEWKQASEVPELAVILTKSKLDNSPPVPEVARAPSPAAARKSAPAAQAAPQPQAAAAQPAPAARPKPKPTSSAQFSMDPVFDDAAADIPHPAQRGGISSLFADVDMPEGEATAVKTFKEEPPPSATTSRAAAPAPLRPTPAAAAPLDNDDPFSTVPALAKDRLSPDQENTGSVIARSGVKKRNGAGKVLAFLVLLIALPVAGAYALHELQIVPVEITQHDQHGNEVKQPVFSEQGVAALRSLLLGEEPPPPAVTRRPVVAAVQPAARPAAPAPASFDVPLPPELERARAAAASAPAGAAASPAELKALYDERKDVAPAARASAEAQPASGSGPGELAIAKVVEQSKASFQGCIERELRTNRKFKGGKATLTATVGASGKVTRTALDRPDLQKTALGKCLLTRANRLVFPAFSGEAVDVEIPLILTTSL